MKNTLFSKWSHLGLGTGRLTSIGRGTNQEEVCRILSWMRTYGATVIDTADSYTSGRSEEMIGNALKGQRDNFVVVTKSGYRYGDLPAPMRRLNPFIKKFHQLRGSPSCHNPSYLLRNLHRSLERLKTEYVDCFLLHDPPLETVVSHEVQQHLLAAKKAGKVLHLGVSSSDKSVLEAAIESDTYSVIQSPGNLSVVTSLKTVWQRATQSGMHIMANHVFYSGDIPEIAIPTHMQKHEYLMRGISQHFINGTILVGTKNENHFKECLNWLDSSE
jgi:aryl-alcohol dehydrogenase-like predicted oxidoreductase